MFDLGTSRSVRKMWYQFEAFASIRFHRPSGGQGCLLQLAIYATPCINLAYQIHIIQRSRVIHPLLLVQP